MVSGMSVLSEHQEAPKSPKTPTTQGRTGEELMCNIVYSGRKQNLTSSFSSLYFGYVVIQHGVDEVPDKGDEELAIVGGCKGPLGGTWYSFQTPTPGHQAKARAAAKARWGI
ncbi:hypothetical protein DSO57_1036275 [Entomophthora muscae]|uniref:Uncharacterized protein n=1 Tax=Entomophthora muscae TaxID=34485 RepID=A0ACC2SC07_9FUNG|nr:hypothetical protein DSO57_1036275 [Entomophthora muscae]